MTGLIVIQIRDGIHRGFFFCKLVIKDNTQNSPDSILKQPVN
ncbi:336R [Invertebrate iridescent virus Kaz2018]|nr:336R [Invertebrate iridescent virus Kaz2018]